MGLLLRLLIWLVIVLFLAIYRFLEAFMRLGWATATFFDDWKKLGFSKAELRYRENFQDALHRPMLGSVAMVRRSPLFFLMPLAVLLVIGMIFAGVHFSHVRTQQKIAQTKQQVETLADQTLAQVIAEEDIPIPAGQLPARDAWHRPITLQRTDAINGTQLVIRSVGPDGEPGNWDDIEATRFHKSELKEIAGDLAGRGTKAIKDRWNKLLGKEPETEEEKPGAPKKDTVILNLGEDDAKPALSVKLRLGRSDK